MNILEAMSQANDLRPCDMDDEEKAGLLERLDAEVSAMMGIPVSEVKWPQDHPLLMQYPYDDVYPLYLAARHDYYNSETDLYENDMEVYNRRMAEAEASWRRAHPTLKRKHWEVF